MGATSSAGQVLFDILWFFLLLVEIYLMFTIFVDIFRRHDMKGWQKALWVLLVLLLPLIGILLYLIIYGNEMKVHSQQAAQEQGESFRKHEGSLPGSSSVDDLARLADLKERGYITDEEFERMKERIISKENDR